MLYIIMIRVAWFDRKTNIYDYGSKQRLSTLSEKKKWVEEQNKMIPTTRYWIEYINYDISNNFSIQNIESTNLIKLESYDLNNKDEENYTDYLLL